MSRTHKILVTGSTGFIGSRLVPALESRGHAVSRFALSLGNDIRSADAFCDFRGKGINTVVHLAGHTFVPDSWKNAALFYEVNTMGTQRALEFCRDEHARIVFVSAYVYGIPEYLPIDEAHPARPNNPYAHSKWLAEEMCRFYSAHMGVGAAILRPFNLYGPGQDERFLIPALLRQARENSEIVVKDDRPRRDYLHVDDFVDACALAVDLDGKFDVFNVGSGRSFSVREIIDAVIAASGKRMEWRSLGQERPNEIPDTVASLKMIESRLGWKPKRSILSSIQNGFKTHE